MCNEKRRWGRGCTWRNCRRVRALSRGRGTFNSTEGEPQHEDAGEGIVGKGKAKVYESKGTPNYSYTIHD